MRWRDQRQSTNVEDRRGMGGKGIAIGGGGIGNVVLVLVVYLCGGGDLSQLLNQSAVDNHSSRNSKLRRNRAAAKQ